MIYYGFLMNKKRITGVELREREFYNDLYKTYYASLCHYAYRILNGVLDEEDVVQEVFIKLWERKMDREEIRTVSNYLYRIVHNACLTAMRDKKKFRNADIFQWMYYIEDLSENEEQIRIEEEYYRMVHHMIASLPRERREVMLLTLEGKKNEEIATELDISVNTVKTLKKRAYSYLRERLPREAVGLLWLILWNDL